MAEFNEGGREKGGREGRGEGGEVRSLHSSQLLTGERTKDGQPPSVGGRRSTKGGKACEV